ncbi:hypothetical protein RF11_11452 [Thelohanellus kitauei]|uniref:Tc1-like transposase DDE domain-containing protein n=1 Tax=Thelohanellus kitauei TaxID=669202 RepID=A0A0C2JQ28_THEKT|nr:hypothetical protein RF11_11452 [Thelohanellus kitauei]
MDNVGLHKCDEINSLFSSNNYTVIDLPRYSPFLNPIDEAFSKVKVIDGGLEPKNSEEPGPDWTFSETVEILMRRYNCRGSESKSSFALLPQKKNSNVSVG